MLREEKKDLQLQEEKKTANCSRRGSNSRPSHFKAPSAELPGTAYKYDALTDCATGALAAENVILFLIISSATWLNLKFCVEAGN